MSRATDFEVVKAMREKVPKPKVVRRSFMPPREFTRMRSDVLRVTQRALADEMIHPETGEPITNFTICRWERGTSPVPLWAARRLKALAAIATSQVYVPTDEEAEEAVE